MRLETVEVEGHHTIEEGGILGEVAGIVRWVAQALPDGFRGFGHCSPSSRKMSGSSSKIYDTDLLFQRDVL